MKIIEGRVYNCSCTIWKLGYWARSKIFKVYQDHDIMSPFSFFFWPSRFISCNNTFMDDYDEILNCNGLKYGSYEIFDTFWFITFYGDQNIRGKRTVIRTRPFLSLVVHLKGFSPGNASKGVPSYNMHHVKLITMGTLQKMNTHWVYYYCTHIKECL